MKTKNMLVLALVLASGVEVAKADFVFGTPVTKVPNVNSSSCDACAAISPDGLELYFLSNRPHEAVKDYCDIWVTRRESADYEWGTPVKLGPPINSSAWEGDPSFSANGLEMYFGDGGPPLWSGFTHRPGGYGSGDIWVSTRATKNDPWGEPKNLGPSINTSAFESDPSLTTDGLEMFFGSDRGRSGDVEIYLTTRSTTSGPWGDPVHLGPTINTASSSVWWDGDPEISPDGLTLFFDSWRSGGYGENDLYMTTRATRDDDWGPAVNLGPNVNSAYSEGDPSLSADGSVLYFIRGQDSDFSSWDLWQVPIIPILKAHNPTPSDDAILQDTWVNLSWSPGHTANSRNVYLGENYDDVDAGVGGTFQGGQALTSFMIGFPGFPYPDGLTKGTTYYWRIDEVEAKGMIHKGNVWSFTVAPGTASHPSPADGAEFVDPNGTLTWEPGFDAVLHYVYVGEEFHEVNNAMGGLPMGPATYNPRPLEAEKTYYWRVDEFDGLATYKGDVWGFTTPGSVGSLKPPNGAVDVKQTQILGWLPGDHAASHQVYFGTDKEIVRNANSDSPEYKGSRDLGSEGYDPGRLEWDTTYYWRIDEVNSANSDSPWVGNVWSFRTADVLIVEDFEDYDIGNNEIWWAWRDGVGYASHPTEPPYPGNGSGSAVGDESTASYMEETNVHGGRKAMPLFYDNSVCKYSEAELTLSYPRDWTEKGVKTLTIWVRGNSANAPANDAEPLYVSLNGSAVVYHDDPNAARRATWTEWNIDLQAFAEQGVDLTNVNTIALGLGNRNNPQAGGSGIVYFDDIRLRPLAESAP